VVGGFSGGAFEDSGCLNGFGTAASVEVSISTGVEGSLVVYYDSNCGNVETQVVGAENGDAACFSGTINSVLFNP
jgi:hypothetical protein